MKLPVGAVRKALPLVIGFAALALGQVLLARGTAPELLGRYSLRLAWVNMAVLLAVAGFQFSATKVLPALVAAGAADSIRFVVKEILGSVASMSVVSAGILAAVVWLNPFGLSPATLPEFAPALVLVPLIAASYARIAIATAIGRLWLGQVPDNVVRPLMVGGSVCLLSASGVQPTWPTLVLVTVAAYGMASLLGGLGLWIQLPKPADGDPDRVALRRSLRSVAGYMGGSNVVISVVKTADLVVVGAIVSPEALAAYVIITRLGESVNIVYFLIDPIALPVLSTLIQDGNTSGLAEAVRSYVAAASTWAVACLAFAAAGSSLVLGLFGSAYVGHDTALVLMIFAMLINALTGPGGHVLALAGLERLNFQTTALASAGYLTVVASAAHYYGIVGAAAAVALYQLSRGLLQARLVERRLRLDVTIRGIMARPR